MTEDCGCDKPIVDNCYEVVPALPKVSDSTCKELYPAKCVNWTGDDDVTTGIKKNMKLPEIIALLFQTLNPTPVKDDCGDTYLYVEQGGVKRPYASVAEANDHIPFKCRYMGKTIRVLNEEYWYFMGINNEHLLKKFNFIKTINQERPDADGNYNISLTVQYTGSENILTKFVLTGDPSNPTVALADSSVKDDGVSVRFSNPVGVGGLYSSQHQIKAYGAIEAVQFSSVPKTKTYAATVSWDVSTEGCNVGLTVNNSFSLTVLNMLPGTYATMICRKAAAVAYEITLNGANNLVIKNGLGKIKLSLSANSVDVISVYYDGVTHYWTYGKQYS